MITRRTGKREKRGMVCVGVREHIHPHRAASLFVSWMAPSTWCNVISRTISLYPTAVLSSDTSSPPIYVGPRVMDFRPRSLYRPGERIKYLLFACAVKPLPFSATHDVCHCMRNIADRTQRWLRTLLAVCLSVYPEDGSSTFLRNVAKLACYTTSHTRR
jgi:hypothetical protein